MQRDCHVLTHDGIVASVGQQSKCVLPPLELPLVLAVQYGEVAGHVELANVDKGALTRIEVHPREGGELSGRLDDGRDPGEQVNLEHVGARAGAGVRDTGGEGDLVAGREGVVAVVGLLAPSAVRASGTELADVPGGV